VGTWLFGILYRKIAEARRKASRDERRSLDDVSEDRFDASGGWVRRPRAVDLEASNDEIRRALEACLEKVPEAQRLAFVLREVEELDTEEICKILDVTRTNLGVMLHRVRNRLRDCLESRGVRDGK
jgi:RNA polymerase sigma-70 factor (ECF subfamily)